CAKYCRYTDTSPTAEISTRKIIIINRANWSMKSTATGTTSSEEKGTLERTPADEGNNVAANGSETQFSVETEEAFESDSDELSDSASQPQDGRVPLRIEEECKGGRFKRV
ncbi:MAG: hypothetical protein P4M11_04560, partial [Candidatus Pacebacteria bacterium]|nr:hypothetical protein [Candidatus Paceibacterota bacterium]